MGCAKRIDTEVGPLVRAPEITIGPGLGHEHQLGNATADGHPVEVLLARALVLFLDLAKVHFYLLDVYEMRRDKKAAEAAVDKAIEAAQRSIQLNDKSADAHSLLADLYGRKISLGNAMFSGPKFGPKVKEENAKAMALDDKNPRVWASLGRQYLMTPKMFGGDVPKAIESFQKSLAFDTSQDETWVWLAKAFQKQGDTSKAREAVQHALSLNPTSRFALATAGSLEK